MVALLGVALMVALLPSLPDWQVPNVWDESMAGRRKNKAFDPLLHKEQLHRAYMREQLGPSFAGKRTDRVVSEVINSYRDLGGSELRAALKKAAVSDILEAVVDESCIYDMTWYNTSDRALWYFPRALLALRRWEAFSACMCNLHFIVEHSMEFSVPSIIDVLTSGIDEQTVPPPHQPMPPVSSNNLPPGCFILHLQTPPRPVSQYLPPHFPRGRPLLLLCCCRR
jgi:hypothetical protein